MVALDYVRGLSFFGLETSRSGHEGEADTEGSLPRRGRIGGLRLSGHRTDLSSHHGRARVAHASAAGVESQAREGEDEQAHIEWAKSFWEATQPYSTESVYVNYLSEEGEERVRAAYGTEHYARLVELKRKYDPGNVFRSNQNIRPDA